MLNRHHTILSIMTLSFLSSAFGQNKLKGNIVADSLIQKFKIKQVTENWFINPKENLPANTTFEIFNESGYKIQRVHINYRYHKFIENYTYNFKKGKIVAKQKYYDWSPHREKNKDDTIVKTSIKKYDLNTKEPKQRKAYKFDQFQIKLTTDSIGRLTKTMDTIKCGYRIIQYAYNENNQVIARNHYVTRHSEKLRLQAIDSLIYNSKGQKIKEINYYGFNQKDEYINHDTEVETLFYYENSGLLKEKITTKKYLTLNNCINNSQPTLYKYEYVFF